MVPDEETTQEMEYGVKERHEDGLVVVTSLISKVPNLGGKCNILKLYNILFFLLIWNPEFMGLSPISARLCPLARLIYS